MMRALVKPFLPSSWKDLWKDYVAAPQDPHDKVEEEKRDEAAEGILPEEFKKATERLQGRYAHRDVSVGRTQEVSAFTFNGIAALCVMIGAGMMATVAFFDWMGLLLLPSFFLACYSVICYLTDEPADDQVNPTKIQDEFVEVLGQIKNDQELREEYEEVADRSMKQRRGLWKSRVYSKRGRRGMRACIFALAIELTIFSVLVVIF